MTIKEIEQRSGMTRANIRFYEAEGLIFPERSENGYRNYSEEDLEILLRIRLLRMLQMSLEEIKKLHNGEKKLLEALEEHIKKLEQQKQSLQNAQDVCKTMSENQVTYSTLDSRKYIMVLEQSNQGKKVLAEDVLPKVKAPWRRFFARVLDTEVYIMLWNLVFAFVFNWNLSNMDTGKSLCRSILVILTFLALEPLLLWKTGTTFGKWILGLTVSADGDRKLNYEEAFDRTWGVLWRGQGARIPIYSIYRQFRSYTSCADGGILEWEEESVLHLKDSKIWRNIVAAVIFAGVFLITAAFVAIPRIPKHRGEITVEQFVENYNRLADYYGLEENEDLTTEGTWEKVVGDFEISWSGEEDESTFEFFEENGVMTGLRIQKTMLSDDGRMYISWNASEMNLAIMAYVWAQDEWSPFKDETPDILTHISENSFENFEFEVCGVSIQCEVEYDKTADFYKDWEILYSEDENAGYWYEFIIRK